MGYCYLWATDALQFWPSVVSYQHATISHVESNGFWSSNLPISCNCMILSPSSQAARLQMLFHNFIIPLCHSQLGPLWFDYNRNSCHINSIWWQIFVLRRNMISHAACIVCRHGFSSWQKFPSCHWRQCGDRAGRESNKKCTRLISLVQNTCQAFVLFAATAP